MAANYCEDYEYLPEDEYRLFVGGEASILRQIHKEHDVQATLLKSRKILTNCVQIGIMSNLGCLSILQVFITVPLILIIL